MDSNNYREKYKGGRRIISRKINQINTNSKRIQNTKRNIRRKYRKPPAVFNNIEKTGNNLNYQHENITT